MAERALTLSRRAREQAVARVLELKKERDQIGRLIENNRRAWHQAQEESERAQLNDLATARHALAAREAA